MDKSKKDALKRRTKQFALDIIKFVDSLPPDRVSAHMGHQLLKSGTSVAANYRSACRGRSNAELFAKLCICEEEADESGLWMELFEDSGKSHLPLAPLLKEADELVAIFVTSKKSIAELGVREPYAIYGEQ
jgi:four helix bundle protein